jgi:hypothetical protein
VSSRDGSGTDPLDTIPARRRELDLHEHQLISGARLGYKDRQAAQQRHQALARTLTSPSQTRTRQS